MPAVWTAPEVFAPAMLGAPFVDMQPEPSAGLRYSLFDLSEPEKVLAATMDKIKNGANPLAATAEFVLALGQTISLINGPLPGGAGTKTKAVGPIFTPEAFDEGASNLSSRQAAFEAALTPKTGAKVAMCCIDVAIAFVNARFRKKGAAGKPDTSRFEMLWIQGRTLKTPGPYSSILRAGTLLLKQDIDALIERHWQNGHLDEDAVYAEFNGPPHGYTDLWSLSSGHGTSALDLMAGEPRDTANDDTPIYGVELPVAVVSDTSGAVFHGPLTYGLGVMAAVSYALTRTASGNPAHMITNVSMGFLAGPADGMHPTARALNKIEAIATGPDTAKRKVDLTLPTGNRLQDRMHACTIAKTGTQLDWALPPEDRTASFVEIWSKASDTAPDVTEITLIPPGETDGVTTVLPAPGERIHLEVDGRRVAQLHNLANHTDQSTHLLVGVYATSNWNPAEAYAPSGLWSLIAKGKGDTDNLFWIARDNTLAGLKSAGRQSWFRDPTYVARDGNGDFYVGSHMSTKGVRRDGTLSVLATAAALPSSLVTTVSGRESRGRKPYRFAGLEIDQPLPPPPAAFAPASEVSRALGGPMSAKRRGRGVVRLSGTSFASAIQARHIADGVRGTSSDPLGYREPQGYDY